MPVKLRIGLVLHSGAAWMGGAEYSRNLIKALYRLPAEVQRQFELRLLCDGPLDRSLYADMPARFQKDLHDNLNVQPASLWRRAARRILGTPTSLAQYAHRLGIQFLFPFHPSENEPALVPSAPWIPDFQHRVLPEFFSAAERAERDRLFSMCARGAPIVVVSSEAAKRDAHQFFPDTIGKTHALPFCTAAEECWYSSHSETVARQYEVPERYFIVCNQFWKHKNHAVVFDALRILQTRGITPAVICTGRLDDYRWQGFGDDVRRQIGAVGLEKQVRILGMIPREDQVQLMRRSLAVIQPSLFEGWSTVVEDCRALGKRLALSDLVVHREQKPRDAMYFPAPDAARLADILAEWWTTLAFGPDVARERHARLDNVARVEDYGRRFLKLARLVHEMHQHRSVPHPAPRRS